MNLKDLPIGYGGQRFQAEEKGYMNDDQWSVIGWSTTREGAQKLCEAIAKAPGCIETRVIDLEPAKTIH